MSIGYEIQKSLSRVAIRFWGKADLDAITRSFLELAGQEDFGRVFDFLTDARQAELALSTVDLNTFAGLYAELLGGGFGRSALVLNKPKGGGIIDVR